MIECLRCECMGKVSVAMSNDDIMSVEHILSTARSVRKKLDFERPIAREDIEACIEVAVQAPTGIAGENWRFLVVTDSEKKAQIAEIYCDVLMEISSHRARRGTAAGSLEGAV